MTSQPPGNDSIAVAAEKLEQTVFEVKKVIVGQDRVVERLLVCLLAKGHALLEGVPGLAKTLAAETIAVVVGGSFARIQFTPDLLPADVMGTRIYRSSTETFDVELGPVFANFVLADEINRAPAKVQSALLEVMAEHQVSIGGSSYPVPQPFLVLATQNPIEQEGVYPLPEAQRDRFLMKIIVDYPTPAEEVEIVQRMGVAPPAPSESLTIDALGDLQGVADSIFVAREVIDYAVSLVLATREPSRFGLADLKELVAYGASPRASLGLVAAGRAMALLRGRSYVLPQDVFDVAPDILRHRLVLSYEALARDISVDDVLGRLLSTVPAPRVAPLQDPSAALPRTDHFGAAPAPSPAPAPEGSAPGPAPAAPSWSTHPEPAGPAQWGTDGRPTGSTGTDGGWPSTGGH
ncbi:MAG: MoxR family ATPase [Actinobacteria bacterium]|nr:MoxR family ATPase [Actinomycetota bacterium]